MKKIIYCIALSSFLLSGNLYFSFDVQSNFKYYSDFIGIDMNESFSDGDILLGYDHTVYQQDQFRLNLGLSFSIKSAKYNGFGDALFIDGSTATDYVNIKTDVYTLYIMPNFQLSDRLNLWVTLGHNSTRINGLSLLGDLDEVNVQDGLMYGIGLRVLTTDHIGLGLGYSVHNANVDLSNTIYSFANADVMIKRLSLDLFYKFN